MLVVYTMICALKNSAKQKAAFRSPSCMKAIREMLKKKLNPGVNFTNPMHQNTMFDAKDAIQFASNFNSMHS